MSGVGVRGRCQGSVSGSVLGWCHGSVSGVGVMGRCQGLVSGVGVRVGVRGRCQGWCQGSVSDQCRVGVMGRCQGSVSGSVSVISVRVSVGVGVRVSCGLLSVLSGLPTD